MPSATMLLTRPLPDAQRFAAMLPQVPAVIAPILRIVPVAHDRDRVAGAAGFVFTSAHAVAAAGAGQGRPALCVGPRTAAAAAEAGFAVAQGPGDAQGLAPLIAASPVPLLYLRGRHVSHDLPVPALVVYDQQAVPLTDQAVELLSGPAPVILPLFSARSTRLLAQAIRQALNGPAKAPVRLAAISESVRSAWPDPCAASVLAPRPDAAGMGNAVISLLSLEQ